VIAVSTPNHPLRLAGILAASVAFSCIVAGAAYALLWMVDDYRNGGRVSAVAGADVAPNIDLPPGLVALQHINDDAQFEQLAGFAPFVPETLPDTTGDQPRFSLTFPDENGVRVGRIGFSPKDGPGVDGITGPLVVLMEAKGTPGAAVDGQLKRMTTGTGRALAATIACGDLVIDVQLYFQPNPAPGEPYVTPYMTGVAQRFLDGVNAQCRG
jgi:hypothetical protein